MADLRLTDIVLLQSFFSMWPERSAPPAEDSDETQAFVYPVGDFLELSSTSSREDDEFVLYLDAKLEADALPFELELVVGARYSVVDQPDLTANDAEPTLVWLVYQLVFLKKMGATPGKRLMKLKVISITGGAPDNKQRLMRAAVSLVSGYAAGLGYIWAFWEPQRRGWHDLMADTRVVAAD